MCVHSGGNIRLFSPAAASLDLVRKASKTVGGEVTMATRGMFTKAGGDLLIVGSGGIVGAVTLRNAPAKIMGTSSNGM